jgi:hypothetical protein
MFEYIRAVQEGDGFVQKGVELHHHCDASSCDRADSMILPLKKLGGLKSSNRVSSSCTCMTGDV